MKNKYYITFYSHYAAMIFKKEIEQKDIKVKLMPVPRSISSSCGTCAMFEDDVINKEDINDFEDIEKIYKLVDNQLVVVEME